MSESPPTLLIAGTGALACLFAARLSRAGNRVTMLGSWPAGLEALRAHGVRLVDQDGEEEGFAVEVASDPDSCRPASLVLVLVKAWQTRRVARQLSRCLLPDGLALTLQNGLGNREALIEHLGEGRVALGSTTTGATLLGPGRVRPGGEGTISLEAVPRLERLQAILAEAGFQVEAVGDVEALLWAKLAINAAINPPTALLRRPNGALLERPELRALMGAAAEEVASVAAARGVHLPFADPAAAAETVAHRTAANHSSMYQDVARGAPTEIDAICGAVVAHGQRLGVPTPVNRTLWQLVSALHPGIEPDSQEPA
jgi:2-dehydropantoate 2-reductase